MKETKEEDKANNKTEKNFDKNQINIDENIVVK
jgi:hypothetical protein